MVGAFLLSGMGATLLAQPQEGNSRDIIVYKEGDRLQGRLLDQDAEVITFQSDRFGLLRVSVLDAVVIKSESKSVAKAPKPAVPPASSPGAKPPAAVVATVPVPEAEPVQTHAEKVEADRLSVWESFSPAVLTARFRDFFGPWHGKVAFSTDVVSDTSDRTNIALEGAIQRKWKANEVQLKARYDFVKTNDVTTTDIVKADGLWRHDFLKARFALYRPTIEWNRAALLGVADYALLQQEIGVGVSLWSNASRKVRVGLSENMFDVWNLNGESAHQSRTVESSFIETEFRLPWRMILTQRAVYYYSISSGSDGWENRIELGKKFTETLSTAIRHEIRRDNPDGRAPDYTRLKLLFGLDF